MLKLRPLKDRQGEEEGGAALLSSGARTNADESGRLCFGISTGWRREEKLRWLAAAHEVEGRKGTSG